MGPYPRAMPDLDRGAGFEQSIKPAALSPPHGGRGAASGPRRVFGAGPSAKRGLDGAISLRAVDAADVDLGAAIDTPDLDHDAADDLRLDVSAAQEGAHVVERVILAGRHRQARTVPRCCGTRITSSSSQAVYRLSTTAAKARLKRA
jgi:hypothetical protein